VAGDWGIAFAGEVVVVRVVGSGHEARVRVDGNRPGVFACRRAGRDVIGGRTGGASVGSVEGVVDGWTGTSLSLIVTEFWIIAAPERLRLRSPREKGQPSTVRD